MIKYIEFYSIYFFYTGVRIGEALALTFADIDNGVVSINKTISKEYYNGKRAITTPKTKKSIRKIHIDSILKNEIELLRKHYSTIYSDFNNSYFVFGGTIPLSNSTVERKKNKWCDQANVKRIRIHDFRHSHATLLITNSIPITAISHRLGHSNVSLTLDTYAHLLDEDEKRVSDTLNSLRLNC